MKQSQRILTALVSDLILLQVEVAAVSALSFCSFLNVGEMSFCKKHSISFGWILVFLLSVSAAQTWLSFLKHHHSRFWNVANSL